MCLSSVTEVVMDKEYVGYKVMKIDRPSNKTPTIFYPPCFGTKMVLNQWKKATGSDIRTDNYFQYPCGFHIFTSIGAAANWLNQSMFNDYYRVVKVKYRKILVKGIQSLAPGFLRDSEIKVPCIVAKEMKVVGIVENSRAIRAGQNYRVK